MREEYVRRVLFFRQHDMMNDSSLELVTQQAQDVRWHLRQFALFRVSIGRTQEQANHVTSKRLV